MRFFLRLIVLSLLATALRSPLAVTPAWAAEFSPAQRAEMIEILREALRKDPTILRQAIEALQADEGRSQDEAGRAALAAERDRLIDPADQVGGNPKGDVTIVEFFDIRCGYCRHMEPVIAELLAQDRNVRLIYKDLPILGPASTLGAKALIAAQTQGGYEKLRDTLMKAGPEPTRDSIRAEAQRQGLDGEKLLRDMESPAVQARIAANLALANRLAIRGTPALIIGDTIIPGAVELAALRQAIATARGAAR